MEIRLPDFPIEGGCVCGAVRYQVKSAPIALYACHCQDCQRFSGAAYSMAMAVDLAGFEVLRGEPKRFFKPADSKRIVGVRYCGDCGTRLWHEPAHSPHLAIIPPGTLDDMNWVQPVAHVWASRKQAWIALDPAALVFDEQPVSREPLYEAFARAVKAKPEGSGP